MIINPFMPNGYPPRGPREMDRVAEELEMRRAWLAAYGHIPINEPHPAVTNTSNGTQG